MWLINDLRKRGITLVPDGENLRVRGKLTDADRDLIRDHKADLLVALSKEVRASGYGCGKCGNKVYVETPEGWKCEGCGVVFSIIGGTRGPIYLN